MITVIAVAAIAAAMGLVATVVSRFGAARRTPAKSGYGVPNQLTRRDFRRPDARWLVVLFSSATCETCNDVWTKCEPLESDAVATENVDYQSRRSLHDRYAIEAVPLTVIADAQGVVRASFLGPVATSQLWAALAEARAAE